MCIGSNRTYRDLLEEEQHRQAYLLSSKVRQHDRVEEMLPKIRIPARVS